MSEKAKKTLKKIGESPLTRHVILAVCGIVVLIFVTILFLNLYTRHNSSETVPDLSGVQLSEAKKVAAKSSLKLEVNDSLYIPVYEGGVILDQLPKPGTKVKPGRRVFLTINSYSQRMVEIPFVTGFSLRQAKNLLEVAGLEIDRLVFRSDIAANNVLEQQFNGKVITRDSHIEAEQGSGVTLIVGMSQELPNPVVPKVTGFPLREAKSRLWDNGLNVAKIEYDDDITLIQRGEAKVYLQSPEQGTQVQPGTAVSLKLSLDQDVVTKGSNESDNAAKKIILNRREAEKQAAEE